MKLKLTLSLLGVMALIPFSQAQAAKKILNIDPIVQDGTLMTFVQRPKVLAMNILYQPILELRAELSKELSLKLLFLTSWDKKGEAHITTITPPEYSVLSKNIKLEEIEQIAQSQNIQGSEVQVLGLGRGVATINKKKAFTFFIIVKSEKLFQIRQTIFEQFVKNGGDPNTFNPKSFYPHITIGYTDRDLHESDGVIKDIEHSLDKQFELKLLVQK